MNGTKGRPQKQFDGLSLARLFLAPPAPEPITIGEIVSTDQGTAPADDRTERAEAGR